MAHTHPSTPAERVQSASSMLAHHRQYGVVTQLSRALGVSRPTLYAWKASAQPVLAQAFHSPTPAPTPATPVERQILTLLVERHTSSTNIQTCLDCLTGQHVSIGTIASVIQEAQRRALEWMATHAPSSPRTRVGRNLCQQPPGRLSQRGR